MRFADRVCVVTGAGQGIGRVAARRFAEEGAHVAYLSRTTHPEVLEEIESFDGRAVFVKADASDPADVRRAFEEIGARFGAADVLVNNAGIAEAASIEQLTAESWDRVMAANVRSCFLCLQAAAPGMKARGAGAVVNVSSIAGRDRSLVLGCAYTTSKAAIIGLTRHAAAELGPAGIRVNCVCPSQTRTPMLDRILTPAMEAMVVGRNPLGRIAEPAEIASVILFLASGEASFMNGAIVDVNGGVR
jgi:NAD(P)-dependent dehydrogenase (short-subunit alcohol dehydrogenase family)